MKLDEFIEIGSLLDTYSAILKDKQKEYLIDHFERDLSLSEIAKRDNISRQAVYDHIKRGVDILYEYEEKLKFYQKKVKLVEELEKLRDNFSIEKLERIIDEII